MRRCHTQEKHTPHLDVAAQSHFYIRTTAFWFRSLRAVLKKIVKENIWNFKSIEIESLGKPTSYLIDYDEKVVNDLGHIAIKQHSVPFHFNGKKMT